MLVSAIQPNVISAQRVSKNYPSKSKENSNTPATPSFKGKVLEIIIAVVPIVILVCGAIFTALAASGMLGEELKNAMW